MRPIPKPKSPRPGRPTGRFTQHRRLDRLRDALESQPAGIALSDLAALLHVTQRSVRRYLQELELITEIESIETVPGGAHLWRIKPSERGRAVPLRRAQAYGLLAGRRVFELMKGSAFFDELDLAHRQILQVASRPTRTGAKGEIPGDLRLEERFLYVPHPPANYGQRAEELDDVFRAVADLYVLRFKHKADGRSERVTAHPYAMIVHRGSIHVIARDVERDEVRVFPFERIADPTLSATERFTLPAELRLEEYLQGQFGIGRAAAKTRVLVEFDARVADEVRARKVHPSQKIATAPDGRVRLSLTVGEAVLPEVKRWILGFAETARVIEPPDFVAEMARSIARALSRYP
jgi:predicted DNA-binding transcriptional regulator YafY